MSTPIFGQRTDVTFLKSKQTYKVKNYIVRRVSSTIDPTFHILYKKRTKEINGAKLHPFHFGSYKVESYRVRVGGMFYKQKEKYDYLSFSGDTIFYYNWSFDERNIKKRILFILNEKAKDTIYIKKLGYIVDHNVVYSGKWLYSAIDDTVYEYKLWWKTPPEDTQHAFKVRQFNSIGISKKYGFVWVEYSYFIHTYRLYFY